MGFAALPHLERANQFANWLDCSNAADSLCQCSVLERPLLFLLEMGDVRASVHGGAGQGSAALFCAYMLCKGHGLYMKLP